MPEQLPNILPVPVDVARQIGIGFHRRSVVIWSQDLATDWMHVATWGRDAQDKLNASHLGRVFTQVAGGDLSHGHSFEDFRSRSAAEAAETIERLTAEVTELKLKLAQAGGAA